jgi:hypothetical protein
MNTDALAKLYDRLKPWERLPLIIAASRRGDDAERLQLAQAAPRTGYRLPDHFELGLAWQEAATMHVIELLRVAGDFWQAWGLWGWKQLRKGQNQELDEFRLLGMVRLHGCHFGVQVEGWGRFCAELQIAPGALVDFMPGYDLIERTRAHVRGLAFTAEEAAAFLRLQGRAPESLLTEEEVLRSWRELLQVREAWWGGETGRGSSEQTHGGRRQ